MSGVDLARRGLLTGRSRRQLAPPRPPWLDEARLADGCTRCGACANACPDGLITAGDAGFPIIDFANGGCSLCGACADACPHHLFARDRVPFARRAAVGAGCLATAGVFCMSCADSCDSRAIRFPPRLGRPPQPMIDADCCNGCGACVSVCPAGAITMELPCPTSTTFPA